MNFKKYITTVLLVIGGTFVLFYGVSMYIATPKNKTETTQQLRSEVFEVGGGYGYHILNGDKVVIEQKFIPAIAGEKSFLTAGEAKIISDLVVSKLKNNDSPTISPVEIHNLNITIPKD